MSVSLCIVTRDEAALLERCIASARPVVDEVVVVDTGSRDGTPECARRAGARVFHADWPGSLGQAHDLPLEHARGDWILSLDGDEVLDPAGARLLPNLLRRPGVEGYRVAIRNYSYSPQAKWRPADPTDPLARGALGYHPTCVVRLFRRRPSHRFSGSLHQSMTPAIRARGGRIADSGLLIHHHGPLRLDRWKSPLYEKLASQQAAAEPRSPLAWVELGTVLLEHEPDRALKAFLEAGRLGDRAAAGFFTGWALVALGRHREAIPWLKTAVRANPRDRAVQYDRADAWELLGFVYESLGSPQLAEEVYRRARRTRPDSPVATNNLAGLLGRRRATREAGTLVDELMTRYRGLDMVWATLGTIRLLRGDTAGARRALETALDIDPRNRAARENLAFAYEQAGRPRLAARARRAAAGSERAGDRRRRRDRRPIVVSLVASLEGATGRAVAEAARALARLRQVVICGESAWAAGADARGELERAGIEVRMLPSAGRLRDALEPLGPACVVNHWTDPGWSPHPDRAGAERWIVVGHCVASMPPGYDAYIVSSAFQERFQTHLPAGSVHRIAAGVDLSRFRPRPRRTDGPVVIAMHGPLDAGRFPRRLLALLPELTSPPARVRIAGSGPRRYEIEPDIRRLGMTATVRFVGPVPQARLPRFLAAAHIGLQVTEMHEDAGGRGVLEMLASGLPVVAQPRGSLPELVISGENGYLADTEEEIAARLAELIRSPALRARMGAAARRTARRHDARRTGAGLRGLVGGPGPEGKWAGARA